MSFKIGDIITALPRTGYVITNTDGMYEVERFAEEDMIVVKVVEHKREELIGVTFRVDPQKFILVDDRSEGVDPIPEDDLSLLFS